MTTGPMAMGVGGERGIPWRQRGATGVRAASNGDGRGAGWARFPLAGDGCVVPTHGRDESR